MAKHTEGNPDRKKLKARIEFVDIEDQTTASQVKVRRWIFPHFPLNQVENLSDFREQFEDAANFGHAAQFIINSAKKRIDYLVTVRCECPCKKRRGLN